MPHQTLSKETISIITAELQQGNKYYIHKNALNKRALNQLKKLEGFKMEPYSEDGFIVLSQEK